MEKDTVIVKHKNVFFGGIFALIVAVFQAYMFMLMADLFVNHIILVICVISELAITAWLLIKGLSEERLNAGGLTFKTPFGTKHYPWIAVERYGIETVQTRRDRIPRIRIHFREEKRQAVIEYREDVLRCLIHYCGQPSYKDGLQ